MSDDGFRFEDWHLLPLSTAGTHAHDETMLLTLRSIEAALDQLRPDGSEVLGFPQVIGRSDLDRSGYFGSFPQLIGAIDGLESGAPVESIMSAKEQSREWDRHRYHTDLVMAPAACYHLYPLISRRGLLSENLYTFDIRCSCYRHEPSQELHRMQAFSMREFVLIGEKDKVVDLRNNLLNSAESLLSELGVTFKVVPAHDIFCGRIGQLLEENQIVSGAKFEIRVPDDHGFAIASSNYHSDKFGKAWNICNHAGPVFSSCLGFGIERVALALFQAHGTAIGQWPRQVRVKLML